MCDDQCLRIAGRNAIRKKSFDTTDYRLNFFLSANFFSYFFFLNFALILFLSPTYDNRQFLFEKKNYLTFTK